MKSFRFHQWLTCEVEASTHHHQHARWRPAWRRPSTGPSAQGSGDPFDYAYLGRCTAAPMPGPQGRRHGGDPAIDIGIWTCGKLAGKPVFCFAAGAPRTASCYYSKLYAGPSSTCRPRPRRRRSGVAGFKTCFGYGLRDGMAGMRDLKWVGGWQVIGWERDPMLEAYMANLDYTRR